MVPDILIDPDMDMIRRKAAHGGRDWLVWKGKDGKHRAARSSPPVIKQAMLDIGTKGRILMYCARSVMPMSLSWRCALIVRNNLRHGY
ncbi:MAG: hypothetical protein EOO77_17905 [Oxalobacteraceae bacterium]|nr:MAG: hypothetical protein EOO77_17905 [Oxalobacteraceae bacterium]